MSISIEKRLLKYLVFEGNDGCGKSTIAESIAKRIEDHGETVVYTKEPGSPHLEFCKKIREIIIHGKEQKLQDLTYAHLFYADAHEHLIQIVAPAIARGDWVISDRSVLSNRGYWPPNVQYVHYNNHQLFNSLCPTVFYIQVPPEVCLERILSRRKEINEFEKEHVIDKINLIHNRYETTVATSMIMERINHYIIDNTRPIPEVVEQVWGIVTATFYDVKKGEGNE